MACSLTLGIGGCRVNLHIFVLLCGYTQEKLLLVWRYISMWNCNADMPGCLKWLLCGKCYAVLAFGKKLGFGRTPK